jgi:hypothetical protein
MNEQSRLEWIDLVLLHSFHQQIPIDTFERNGSVVTGQDTFIKPEYRERCLVGSAHYGFREYLNAMH